MNRLYGSMNASSGWIDEWSSGKMVQDGSVNSSLDGSMNWKDLLEGLMN